MRRLTMFFGLVTLGLALLVSAGATQDAKKDKDDKKDPPKVKGMLPPGFKDLGLSKEQVFKIYGVQTNYRTKIADLEKKVKELKAQESQEVFKVLTEEQREKYLKAKGVDTKEKSAPKDAKDDK